jgi:hypothetical protein
VLANSATRAECSDLAAYTNSVQHRSGEVNVCHFLGIENPQGFGPGDQTPSNASFPALGCTGRHQAEIQ